MGASLSFGKRRIAATVTTQDGEELRREGMVMWVGGEIATRARAKEYGDTCKRAFG
jgi:hypothetical protein